jgi:hypothetical protein
VGIENVALIAFNRGRVSRLALARTDVKRVAFSADAMTNWMARVMGAMMLRPGLGYLGAIPAAPRVLPFVFSTTDTALMEFTNAKMRVWVGDALISRSAVSTAVTNGNFNANLANWTTTTKPAACRRGSLAATWGSPAMAPMPPSATSSSPS